MHKPSHSTSGPAIATCGPLCLQVGFEPEDIVFDPNILTVGTGLAEHNNYGVDFFRASRVLKHVRPASLGVRLVCTASSSTCALFPSVAVLLAFHPQARPQARAPCSPCKAPQQSFVAVLFATKSGLFAPRPQAHAPCSPLLQFCSCPNQVCLQPARVGLHQLKLVRNQLRPLAQRLDVSPSPSPRLSPCRPSLSQPWCQSRTRTLT